MIVAVGIISFMIGNATGMFVALLMAGKAIKDAFEERDNKNDRE